MAFFNNLWQGRKRISSLSGALSSQITFSSIVMESSYYKKSLSKGNSSGDPSGLDLGIEDGFWRCSCTLKPILRFLGVNLDHISTVTEQG